MAGGIQHHILYELIYRPAVVQEVFCNFDAGISDTEIHLPVHIYGIEGFVCVSDLPQAFFPILPPVLMKLPKRGSGRLLKIP